MGRVEGGGGGECADEAVAKGADAIVAGDGGEDGAGESQIAGCYFFPELFQSGE